MEDTVYEGKVKWFNNAKGYGFLNLIVAEGEVDETIDYFVHFSQILVDGFKTLTDEQLVTFSLIDVPGKGIQAINVKPLR